MSEITTILLKATHDALYFSIRPNGYAKSKSLAHGEFIRLGSDSSCFKVTTDEEPYTESFKSRSQATRSQAAHTIHSTTHAQTTHAHALRYLIDWLHHNSHIKKLRDINQVIYELQNGSIEFHRSMVLSRDDLPKLHALSQISPDGHAGVAVIEAGMRMLHNAKHIAVFETAFTVTMPKESREYALPKQLVKRYAIRRSGANALMHKASYEEALAMSRRLPRKIVSVVIDDTVSVMAILDGVALETTTGFTDAEGLPGLFNSGSIDPRIPLYLGSRLRMSARDVDAVLTHKSGLYAMTGKRSYAEILSAAPKDKNCITALMLLSYKVSQAIAGMTASLGGVPQMMVFCGKGASMVIIEEICRRLGWMGVKLDKKRRTKGAEGKTEKKGTAVKSRVGVQSSKSSRVTVVTVHVEREEAVLREASKAM